MKNTNSRIGLVLVVAVGYGGCDSSNSSGNTTTTSGRSPTGECYSSTDGTDSTTCSGQDAYDACITQACDAKYQACFGANYKSGSYGGVCKAAIECIFGCSCNGSGCEINCMVNASAECQSCMEAMSTCEEQSGCVEPVCENTGTGGAAGNATGGANSVGGGIANTTGGALGTGGTSTIGAGGAAATGGAASTGEGGSVPLGTGGAIGTSPGVCPYTVASFDCTQACANLKSIAAKCETDPAVSAEVQAMLQLASSGTGTACKAGCAASSPSDMTQWKCFQGVPVASDCTAIAGCTVYNCPP